MEARIKIQKWGNNLGVNIPAVIANGLSLREGLYVNVKESGNRIVVDYFVILDVRVHCVIIWTAFVAEYEHEKRKKEKEYQNWVKGNGGKIYSPDSLISKIINTLTKSKGRFEATP